MAICCVSKCKEVGTHKFPSDEKTRKKWIKAARCNKPNKYTRICRKHFINSDYKRISIYTGVEHLNRHLKKNAVPSVFEWSIKPLPLQAQQRMKRLHDRNERKEIESLCSSQTFTSLASANPSATISSSHGLQEIMIFENVESEEIVENETSNEKQSSIQTFNTIGTQTSHVSRLFATDMFFCDDECIHYYTGLESVSKFNLVLSTLLPMAHNLQYRWSKVKALSTEDQFLILLIKLRRNKPDYELSKMFGVSKAEISNVIVTWIEFVSDLWSLLDTWPSKKLVDYYMPDSFRANHKTTRLIIDGTEIPIQKPSHPDAQRATFSTYKHKNTVKFLVGASPGGLITYCSDAYAGSTSDRQIVERSNLFDLVEKGDSIMADRGFNVQDLFVSKGVGVNIPTFLKGKSQIPNVLLKHDQKLASERVHIERLIGLTKTFKILVCELNQNYVPLVSKIFKICIMLSNFRQGIVKNKTY